MKISTYTDDQLKNSRKAGFKAKRPKKPKASATKKVLENWIGRYNDWVKKVKAGDSKFKGIEADKKARIKLKDQIRNV